MCPRLCSLFLVSVYALLSNAQSTVVINGRINDAETKRPVGSVSIVNPKAGITNVSLPDGTFKVTVKQADTLFLFLPGYQTIRFSVADSTPKPEYNITFLMKMLITEAKAVVIRPKKTLSQIEEDRKKLGETPAEIDPPKIEPFTSPISALYDLLSDETRQKRKLRGQIIEDNRRKLFYALFEYYRENGVLDIEEEHYDGFINFCNLPIEFLKYNTDYEITKTIVEQYKRYTRLTGIVK